MFQKSCPFSGHDFWPAFFRPREGTSARLASSRQLQETRSCGNEESHLCVQKCEELTGEGNVRKRNRRSVGGVIFASPRRHTTRVLEGRPRQPTTTSVRLWLDARSSITSPLTCALLTCSSAHTNPPRNRHRGRIYVNHGGLTDN